MEENMNSPQEEMVETREEEMSQEMKEAVENIQRKLDDTKQYLKRRIYKSINFDAMFATIGQPDKSSVFKEYTEKYEEDLKKLFEENKGRPENEQQTPEPPKLWGEFLDREKPVTAGEIANIWDQMISMSISLAIDCSEAMIGTVYDAVIGPQFMATEEANEQFAGAIGELLRRVEAIEKSVYGPKSERTDEQ